MMPPNNKNENQKKLPLRNYNIFALQGDDSTTDMDVVETMGLDPIVAYTPDINAAAIQKMQQENVEGYMRMGISETLAKSMAETAAMAAKASINALMAEQKIDFKI